MVRPHTKNGLLKDGEKKNWEPTDWKAKNKMAGWYV
jgi:hypothetical protein